MIYGLIDFPNTHSAMACEEALRNSFNITVAPTPTCITESCGISIRFNMEDLNKIIQVVEKNDLIYKNVYKKLNNEYIKLC